MLKDIEDRPVCKCHGEPMIRAGKGSPECREAVRARARRWYTKNRDRKTAYMRGRYQERVAAGLCPGCGTPDTIGTICWDCLNIREANRALTFRP